MSWELDYYNAALQGQILAMSADLQARYIHLADRIEDLGANLGMPHTRAMGDGLFELRLKGSETIARVFYCTLVGRRIMMLHSFIQKSQKTPKTELGIARRRMAEVKARDAESQKAKRKNAGKPSGKGSS